MAKELQSLSGRVVAITGGARGIGRATAERLVREGARVAIGDVDVDAAVRTAGEIGPQVSGHALDVTDRSSFEAFVDEAEAAHGPVDVLVNNAGIMPLGAFVDESDATTLRQMDINVHGVIFGMKIVLPRMLARNRGHIVNIASMAGKGGFPGGAVYCATKHAIVGVSEAVRSEVRDTPIEISCVMPALVNTDLGSGVDAGRAVRKLEATDVAEAIVDALRRPRFDVPVPRYAGYIAQAMSAMPRGAREAAARFFKADRMLADHDPARRAAYVEKTESIDTHAAESVERDEEAEPVS